MPNVTQPTRDPFAFARDDERGTNRLEGFTDGIFATAATLLIFNVVVPETDGTAQSLINGLSEQWPIYAGLVLSYVLIASTWANHHRLYRYIARTNHTLLVLNTLMMLTVVVIPFITTVLATTLANPDQTQIGTFLYGGIWTIGGISYNATWWYAVRANLIDPEMPPEAVRITTRRIAMGPILYGLGFIASFIHPYIALPIFVLPAILFLLPERIVPRPQRLHDETQPDDGNTPQE